MGPPRARWTYLRCDRRSSQTFISQHVSHEFERLQQFSLGYGEAPLPLAASFEVHCRRCARQSEIIAAPCFARYYMSRSESASCTVHLPALRKAFRDELIFRSMCCMVSMP